MMKYTPDVRSDSAPITSAARAPATIANSQITGMDFVPDHSNGAVRIGSNACAWLASTPIA